MNSTANGDFFKTVFDVSGGVRATVTVVCYGRNDFEGVVTDYVHPNNSVAIFETSLGKARRRINKRAKRIFKNDYVQPF